MVAEVVIVSPLLNFVNLETTIFKYSAPLVTFNIKLFAELTTVPLTRIEIKFALVLGVFVCICA